MSLPSLARACRTASFRLTLAYAAVFTATLIVPLLGGGYLSMAWIEAGLRERVEEISAGLEADGEAGGLQAVAEAIRELLDPAQEHGLYINLQDIGGTVLAGNLDWVEPRAGWVVLPSPEDPDEELRVAKGSRLGPDFWLLVGIDGEPYYDRRELVLVGTAWLAAFALPLALFCGWLISAMVLRRIAQVTQTAAAIAQDGKLDRRIPLQGTGDEFDGLAAQLNTMLAGIEELTQNIRHVSTGIAHDLRTPLTRLRNRLVALEEGGNRDADEQRQIEQMLAELDGLLGVFDALLRIARIDSFTGRTRFAPVDLSALLENVAETYGPVAAEAEKSLATAIEGGVEVEGDPELLTQMVVNLLENAIQHTPPGTRLRLGLARRPAGVVIEIGDDGPGIAAADRERVFERFYRADASRGTGGHGLGLALVRAIARLHTIEVALRDNAPGLVVALRFAHGRA